MENPTYLGDGVYAHFDGYGINLSVNDHRNPPVVCIEPAVLEALNRFSQAAWSGKVEIPKQAL